MWWWIAQARQFIGVELENTAISGLAADPDTDGMENLQEYAFGYHPRQGARDPVAAGTEKSAYGRLRLEQK